MIIDRAGCALGAKPSYARRMLRWCGGLTKPLVVWCLVFVWLGAPGVRPASAAQINCPSPPPAVKNLALRGYYKDKAKSVVSHAALARRRAAVKPLNHFVNVVARYSDRAIDSNPAARRAGFASCGLQWLRAWADKKAYLGRMRTKQAEAQRKWDLAGLALAYLKLRPYAGPADRQAIEPWLRDIADRARAVYDSPGKIRNNHWYWLGLGLGAVGLATNSERHWDEASRIMLDATSDIAADGTLPLELKRGKRALHYHTFSAMPLVVLAELATAKGEDWYALGNGALHRLIGMTAGGLVDPELFDGLAGVKQERPIRPRAGWLMLYAMRFPNGLPRNIPPAKRSHRWLGGDVRTLSSAITALTTSQ